MAQQMNLSTQIFTEAPIEDWSPQFESVPADMGIQPKAFAQVSRMGTAQFPPAMEDAVETLEAFIGLRPSGIFGWEYSRVRIFTKWAVFHV